MKRHEADRLIAVIKELAEESAPRQRGDDSKAIFVPPSSAFPLQPPPKNGTPPDMEAIYQFIKGRFLDDARVDPILLKLLTDRPEIVIEVEPRVVTLEGSTMIGRVARLVAAGWFQEPRATSAVRYELARTGPDPGGGGTLSAHLNTLKKDGFLEDQSGKWVVAAGVKVSEKVLEKV